MNANSYRYWASLGDAYRWMPGSEKKANDAYDHAIDLARKQMALNARDALATSRLAECLAKRGRIREAQTEIHAALHIDPTETEAMKRAAIVALLSGSDEEAAKLLANAVRRGYNRGEIERDPEFAILRQKAVFREVAQASTTMAPGPH
jgi:Flp pilus assembly protein TadD